MTPNYDELEKLVNATMRGEDTSIARAVKLQLGYRDLQDDNASLRRAAAKGRETVLALLSERKRLREALEDQCYCANLNDLAEMHFEPRDQVCEPCQALAASSSPEPEATGGRSVTEQEAQAKAKEITTRWRGVIVEPHLAGASALEQEIAAALLESYRQGEESMRERAALESEKWWKIFDFDSFDLHDIRRIANPNHIATCIRALSPEGQGDHAEGGGE